MGKETRRAAATELVLRGGKRPQLRRASARDWTAPKRQLFLEVLAETCNIAEGLRAVKMTRTGLRHLVARDAGFRAEYRAVEALAMRELTMATIDRLSKGVVKTLTKADGKVETVHEYPVSQAIQLIRLHKENVEETEREHDEGTLEEVRARVQRKVLMLAQREAEKMERERGEAEAGGGAA
jgi:hypothetical protein